MMLASDCPDCTTARASARASLGAWTCECTCGRVHAARVVRVYRAADGDPTQHAPLARAGAAATALRAEDPELARVRTLLAALRPDHPDPWEPMPAAPAQVIAVKASSRAPWDVDLPRGLTSSPPPVAVVSAADVLSRLAGMPADAACVLRWLRREASLASGLRGLWHDVGMAFASAEQRAAWEDLTVRRGFAPAHGRRLVLRAAEVWERGS